MFLASLRVYDRLSDSEGSPVTLRLSDESICLILDQLNPGIPIRVSLSDSSVDAKGSSVAVDLEWRKDLAGFNVSLRGRPAGLITYDELEGALGLIITDEMQSCVVCLSGSIDVVRRGVLNLNSGMVNVFTRAPGLSFLGAHAFLSGSVIGEFDGLRFTLDKGDAANGPLRVPSHQLYQLQTAGRSGRPVAKPDTDTAIENLLSMSQQVCSFYGDAKNRIS